MKYLFFDSEFATTKNGIYRMCEFGYVVTDENFNVVNRGNFIIDPYINRNEWDYWVVRKLLKRTIHEYESNPRFDEYYDEISDLFYDASYVFGHTLLSDVEALNQEIQRYKLYAINFKFYDVKEIYKRYSNIKKSKSVTNILSDLHIGGEDNVHDAESDAYNTMLILKSMIDGLEMNINELLELVPNIEDNTNNFKIKSIEEINKKRLEQDKLYPNIPFKSNNLKYGSNYRRFVQYLDNVKPNNTLGNVFEGKKISISLNYQEYHFKQMLNLIELISNNGGTLILKASQGDIFVKYNLILEDGTLRKDSKYNYVLEANNNGANIEIIEFDELLNRLNITEQELNEMPLPSYSFLLKEDAIIKNKKDQYLREQNKEDVGESNCTLGKLFPDVFDKLLKEIEEDE